MSAAAGLQIVLPAVLSVVAVVSLALVWWVYHTIERLERVEPQAAQGPRVSIIVAARNEAVHIRAAVASLLGQDYHDCELIVVDDRSSDGTGEVLDKLAAKTSRVGVAHIKELPPGWLGKNYALHTGARRATGDVFLFIDGDVILERTAVSRAMRVLEPGADHVVVLPQMELPSRPLQLVVGYFLTWGGLALRLWAVEDPKSSASVGVGAFNFVRKSAYRAAGGHERIPMRPDDDIMLGKILKKSGARQRALFGQGMVSVEWYASIREATLGFRKNAFAALNYSVALFLFAMVANLAIGVWPFVAVWLSEGPARLLYAVTIAALLAAYAKTCIEQQLPVWLTLFYPLGALLETGMLVIAVMRTLVAGGIDWRGTFYPLAALKANRV